MRRPGLLLRKRKSFNLKPYRIINFNKSFSAIKGLNWIIKRRRMLIYGLEIKKELPGGAQFRGLTKIARGGPP